MRVVVNQLAALGLKTGIGHYTSQLLRCLRAQAGPDQIDAYPEGLLRKARETGARLRPRLEGHSSPQALGQAAPPSFRSRAIWYLRHIGRTFTARHFRTVCRLRRYDLYHEPNFIPLPSDRPTIVTLHDLSVLLHPEWHPADRVAFFEKHFHRELNRCVHFLTISEFGRQEVIRVLHLPPERVTRTYMGIRPGLAPLRQGETQAVLRQLQLPARYLLCLGTIEPRKNLLMLLRAYCDLPASIRERWPLVLVGSWGWNTGSVATYLHDVARHRGVLHFGYVADQHVAALYNGARALLYPSLYEGFGLPPIEMMACGGAVLASTAEALRETVGARAYLIEPQDQSAWRAAMLRIVSDDSWWQELRQGVEALAEPYTWDRCAAITLDVYRELCSPTTARRQAA